MRVRATVEADGHFLDAIHAEYTRLYMSDAYDDVDTVDIEDDNSEQYYKENRNRWWQFVEMKRREFKILGGFKNVLNGDIVFGTKEDAVWFALKWS